MDQLKAGVSKALPVLVGGSAFIAPSISNALTKDDLSSLSYLQVHPLAFLPRSLPPVLQAGLSSESQTIHLLSPPFALNPPHHPQVKGTGLANRCPEVVGEGSIGLQPGKVYQLGDLCLEPKTWQVWIRERGKEGGKGRRELRWKGKENRCVQ